MQYTMKAGVLYQGDSQIALAKIKSVLIGSQKKIYKVTVKPCRWTFTILPMRWKSCAQTW